MKKLVLLDAHAIIHRAYHALPNFSTSSGVPTGALYGLSTMLISIIRDLSPDYCIACFDLPEPTHRHKVFKEYKKGRKKADEELIEQIKKSRDVFDAFGIPIYEHPGYEADDILGTITHLVLNNKIPNASNIIVAIASGDMDTLQLVNKEKVTVYTLRKGIKDTVLYDQTAVEARFGFPPNLLPDYKGLRGDPSDNIPGIPGIGEKTAGTLISSFGNLDNIYKTLKKDSDKLKKAGIKPRAISLLSEGEEEAYFSKMLATIKCDAPIKFSIPEERWIDGINLQKITKLFAELEFRTLGERIKKLIEEKSNKHLESRLVNKDDKNDLNKKEHKNIDEIKLEESKIALWLLRSDITSPSVDDVLHFGDPNNGLFSKAYENIMEKLKKRNLYEIFIKVERPLIPVIKAMSDTGIKLDIKYLKRLSEEYHGELNKLEKEIYKNAGCKFNIRSPKQLGEILFDKLGLKPKNQKKTASGMYSTRESELHKLLGEHAIVEKILSYRELQKLLSTYIDNLPAMTGRDGRLHTEFIQTGTSTGRLSSRNPNLQNIPIKTELGKRVREAFVAEEGFKLVSLDYSQIELRVAAILSGDEKLIKIFKNGGDVHSAVASEVFGIDMQDVTREHRRKAKVINFGILYGMGVNALRANLSSADSPSARVSTEEARKYLNAYFEKFNILAGWIDKTKTDAARLGYTQTLFGRRRYFDGFSSKLPHIRASAERMAINAPIQGTSADMIKIAMLHSDKYIEKNGLQDKIRLLLQVHDELVYEMEEKSSKKVAKEIKNIMENVLEESDHAKTKEVPIIADIKVGDNWGALKKL